MANQHRSKRQSGDRVDPELNPQYANIPAEPEQPTTGERVGHLLWEVVKTVGFIVIAALLIRTLIIQPFFVQGDSMNPDFHNGDYLLVNQLSYRLGKPQRGDVVVFKAPPEPETNYIKRIIGLPGETVELKDGRYYIYNQQNPSGVQLPETYIAANLPTLPESSQTRWQLGADQYFVSGDNREPGKSSDSRAWGPVPRANLIGRAWLRVYPLDAFGIIKHHRYGSQLGGQVPTISAVAQPAQ